jgi:hypothetical protein
LASDLLSNYCVPNKNRVFIDFMKQSLLIIQPNS